MLNLLPLQDKKNLKKHYLILLSKDVILSFLLLISILSIILSVSHFMLSKNFIELSQSSLSIMSGHEIITQKIRQINRDLKKISEIEQGNTNWLKIILSLSQLIPPGEIQLNNLEIQGQKNQIFIQGSALSRTAFLTFKDNLEKTNLFSEIQSPLTNLLSAKNLDFELSFKIK